MTDLTGGVLWRTWKRLRQGKLDPFRPLRAMMQAFARWWKGRP